MASAGATLHPHSTTHSASTGATLPALRAGDAHGGAGERLDASTLCFDPRALGSAAPFDAHAFVTQALQQSGVRFRGVSGQDEAKTEEELADAQTSAQAAALLQQAAAGLSPLAAGSSVGAVQPSLPLEILREHLTRYQLYVKGELVELLNAEYARFIGLSSSISGLDTLVSAMQSQLASLTAEVDALSQRLQREALGPFQQKLLQQRMHEQHKQALLHAVQHILTQTRTAAALLQENEQQRHEEADAAAAAEASKQSDSKEHEQAEDVLLNSAHKRLITHHIAASQARAHQRTTDLKQQRRAAAVRGTNPSSGAKGHGHSHRAPGRSTASYADLRLDIPTWMLRQYADASGQFDSDDEEEDEDSGAEEEDEKGSYTAHDEAEDTEIANDAFGLYEALLKLPTTAPAQSAGTATAMSPSVTRCLSSLRPRLVRVERAAACVSIVRSLLSLPACAAFQLVRDLRAADGTSGLFDQVQAKLTKQAKAVCRELLSLLAEEYMRQTPPPAQTDSNAALALPALSFPLELVSLLRASLRALTFLDLRVDGEEIARQALVQPVLQRDVQAVLPQLRAAHALDEEAYWRTYGEPERSEKSDGDVAPHPLRTLYAHLLHFLRGPMQLLLQARADPQHDGYSQTLTTAALLAGSAVTTSHSPSSPAAPAPALLPFSFLSSSFLSELVSYLSSAVGSVLFSSGLPHVFRAHFGASKAFLAQLDTFVAEQNGGSGSEEAAAAIAALHSHASWTAFQSRWNTGIYFQLRFQTIAAAMETAALKAVANGGSDMLKEVVAAGKDGSDDASASGASGEFGALRSASSSFRLPLTRALWSSLCSCFSSRMFLSEVAHRFLKLALQCLQRFLNAVDEIMAKHAPAAAGGAAGNAPAAPGADQSVEAVLLLLITDLQQLSQLLPSQLLPHIARTLGVRDASSARVRAALEDAVAEKSSAHAADDSSDDGALLRLLASSFLPSLKRCSTLLSSAQTSMSDLLLSRCTPSLSYVSRIKPAYRFSRQPTHALQYVRAMMQPLVRAAAAIDSADLRALVPGGGGNADSASAAGAAEMDVNEGMADDVHDQDPLPHAASAAAASQGGLLSSAAREDLLCGVVSRLASAYAAEASKCLSGDIFGELSKKLNKRTAAAAPGGGAEVDKTRRQLQLDAQLFGRIVREQIALQDAATAIQPLVLATQNA